MLFQKFAMLLERIHSLKFLRIQTVKEPDIEHGGLYRWKAMHWFEQQSIRQLLYMVGTTQSQQFSKRL
jgi:hypothetical protein